MLKDYIMVVDSALPNKLCADILEEYGKSTEWKPAGIGEDNSIHDIRKCEGISMSEYEVIKDNFVRKELDNQVHSCLTKAIEKYFEKFNSAMCFRDTGYELLRYSVGGKYDEHIDYNPNVIRNLTVSFNLNDEYKGGEFSFFNNTNLYKLKRGSCIIFPSNFMFPHGIMPVTEGIRYAIITWMR